MILYSPDDDFELVQWCRRWNCKKSTRSNVSTRQARPLKTNPNWIVCKFCWSHNLAMSIHSCGTMVISLTSTFHNSVIVCPKPKALDVSAIHYVYVSHSIELTDATMTLLHFRTHATPGKALQSIRSSHLATIINAAIHSMRPWAST